MCWQYKEIIRFWLVMVFFIMTGLAIIVYLNQYPNQPRERDYAYVGSFDAFAIWIGIGYVVFEKASEISWKQNIMAVTFVVLIAAVPVLMASQNWDDHNRSGPVHCKGYWI